MQIIFRAGSANIFLAADKSAKHINGMKTVEEHINSINTKLQQLLKKYVALQKENTILHQELEEKKQMKNDFWKK